MSILLPQIARFSRILPLGVLLCLLCGCGEVMIPVTSQTTLTSSATISPRTSYTAFGDSITCGYVAAGATTTTPFSIGDASCHTANAYPSYLAASWKLPLENYAIPGDQACDLWPRQIAPQAVNPTLASAPLYTVLIGTNDASVKGAGPYETNYTSCETAALAWLALPEENKVTLTTGTANGWSFGSIPIVGPYAIAHTSGATLTFTVTTTGGPIYLWHTICDRDAGNASVTVDNVTVGGWATTPAVQVGTQNGTYNTIVMERFAGVPAGVHTVVITDAGGNIAVTGLGTTPKSVSPNHPVVLAGSVPAPLQGTGDYLRAADAAYTADTVALVNALHADGLDVRFASNAAVLLGTSDEMTDIVHVSPLGATHLAAAFSALKP